MQRHTYIYFYSDNTIVTSTGTEEVLATMVRVKRAYEAQMIVHVHPTGRVVVEKDKLGRYAPGTVLPEIPR